MKLEDIGFYSLYDKRAKNVNWSSDLKRCEVILTHRCNFNCLYCRGLKSELQKDLTFEEAKNIVDLWSSGNCENIRFSGGEPTLWPKLLELIKYTRSKGNYKHIALSTNGSAEIKYYLKLLKAGINDFSISLDSCCSLKVKEMDGKKASLDHISKVIKILSKKTYVTVGIVVTDDNITELSNIIEYASSLGVSDIRIISSAQSNKKLELSFFNTNYKILNYRLNNMNNGRHVRGIKETDCNKCHLIKDDMVIVGNKHFPCVIYMREQGKEIGIIDNKSLTEIRLERKQWFDKMDIHKNKICKQNCLDVCIDYNNKVKYYEGY